MHAAGWAGDHPGGVLSNSPGTTMFSPTYQVHGGRHDQAGSDRGPDRGCRKLECGEQHRGGKTKLKAAQRWKDSPIESKTFHC